jgi:2-oxoglutarate dehydrogenase E2 component (dihydrolipoamide succinyltransferase)
MPVDVTVPELGESISEVEVGALLKAQGDAVALDEPLLELESDKATVEVPAPVAGQLVEILVAEGDVLKVGDVLARIAEGESGDDSGDTAGSDEDDGARGRAGGKDDKDDATGDEDGTGDGGTGRGHVMPAARRAMEERGVSRDEVEGSGPGGRVLKEDVVAAAEGRSDERDGKDEAGDGGEEDVRPRSVTADAGGGRETRRERMSPIRRRIAERLVQSQQTAALLTTFNEIDMSRVKALRSRHQEAFTAKYGVKLGFMSFFVTAAVEALRKVPGLNAQIDGQEIVHFDYCDIGIAVGGGKGLVVPVIRNAETLDFGTIEQTIGDFAERAQKNRIDLDELVGGTFTISNGGVYGSLLSTPIINPPQCGVLGLHAIQDRPVVIDGEITVRPMMYVALTYDHRLVDGREAVTFLKHVKECVEQPERLLLKV